ncbi:MAG: hypothetical protein WBO58_20580 [Gammaproteobacteria bacterium]
MRRGERPLMLLPRPLLLGFLVLFACQLFYHHANRAQTALDYQALDKPLSAPVYRGIAMGSEQLLGYLLAIRLQLHDNQAGQHFRYSLIDYEVLIEWLDRITETSPGTEYPMLLASRVYTTTNDQARLRAILGFIQRRFDDDPQLHWRRLAEATVISKYKLDDLELALAMAEKLAQQPASVEMPNWARDFQFLLLAELNELESAIALIEALLQTDAVHDPDEKRFLEGKLLDFQQKLFESRQPPQD